MPPKISKQVKKPTKPEPVAEPESDNPEEENVDNDDLPDLEPVSNITKERFEYTPKIRTEIVYRLPEDRQTSEVMTKFELCEILSIRAKQIEKKSTKIFTDAGELTDPIEIAKKEVMDKRCPFSIVRMLTDKVAEKWQVNEMAIPYDAF